MLMDEEINGSKYINKLYDLTKKGEVRQSLFIFLLGKMMCIYLIWISSLVSLKYFLNYTNDMTDNGRIEIMPGRLRQWFNQLR